MPQSTLIMATPQYKPIPELFIEIPRQLVRGMIGHRRQRERQIMRLLGEEARSVSALVPVMYAGVAQLLWPAAGQSVLAHLLDLERQGRVQQSGGAWHALAPMLASNEV